MTTGGPEKTGGVENALLSYFLQRRVASDLVMPPFHAFVPCVDRRTSACCGYSSVEILKLR